jgi:hypothetical protein
MRCPREWEIYRDQRLGRGDTCNGALRLPARNMQIIFSNGMGWEHVSVSCKTRCPSWEEMAEIKRRFWQPDDVVMQLHVADKDHINCHPFCLHLWRPLDAQIPVPPGIMVGPHVAA